MWCTGFSFCTGHAIQRHRHHTQGPCSLANVITLRKSVGMHKEHRISGAEFGWTSRPFDTLLASVFSLFQLLVQQLNKFGMPTGSSMQG